MYPEDPKKQNNQKKQSHPKKHRIKLYYDVIPETRPVYHQPPLKIHKDAILYCRLLRKHRQVLHRVVKKFLHVSPPIHC